MNSNAAMTHRGANTGVAIIFAGIEGMFKKNRERNVHTTDFGSIGRAFILLETERYSAL